MNDEGVDLNDLPGVQYNRQHRSLLCFWSQDKALCQFHTGSQQRKVRHVNFDRFCYSQDA